MSESELPLKQQQQDSKLSNVFRLQAKRTEINQQVRKQGMSLEQRLAEAEADIDRLIQLAMDQVREIQDMDRRQSSLVNVLLSVSDRNRKLNKRR